MPRYIVGNGRTGDCLEIQARSPRAACECLGWVPSECEVVELRSEPDPTSEAPPSRRFLGVSRFFSTGAR